MALFDDLKKIPSPASAFKNTYNRISATDKFAYFVGFAFCLLSNMFVYTNTCFIHDSIQIYNDSTGITNGRFLVGPLLELTNRIQIPWIIGLITCFFMGFVIVFMSKIFKLNNKISIILCAGFVVTSEAIVSSHLYFSSIYIYVLSLLFAVSAVYFADKQKVGIPISILLLCISMMCYQAYISTAIGLFIFKMCLNIIENKSKIKKQILLTVKYASISVLAAAVYYAVWQVVLKRNETGMSDYYAYKNLNSVPTANAILERIDFAWNLAIQLLYRNDLIDNHPILMMFGCFLTLIALVSLIIIGIKKRRVVFTVVYILTYILSINLMFIISGTILHPLTVFSIVIPFLVVLYLGENYFSGAKTKNLLSWISLILCTVMIFGQTVCANSLYLKAKINYDNAWSYATRLIDRLEQTEGFDKDAKVVIISTGMWVTEYDTNTELKSRLKYHTRVNIFYDYLTNGNAITYGETLQWFIQQEMDMDINITTNPEEFYMIDEINELTVFPDKDSIKRINGAYVVRIC